MFDISADQISRIENVLSGVHRGASVAIRNANKRALTAAKTAGINQTKARYTLKQGEITKAVRIKSTGNIGRIEAKGHRIKLTNFNLQPTAPITTPRGGKVTVEVVKGKPVTMPHAYYQFLGVYPAGVFFHEKGSSKSTEFMGPAVAEILGRKATIKLMEETAQKVFYDRSEHEIMRLLSGIGGNRNK